MVLMYAVNAMGVLRVSREGELYGLDLHEHGIAAYPEYVITALGSPSGSTIAAEAPVHAGAAAPSPVAVPARS
jgi:Amt family ammonium transporter